MTHDFTFNLQRELRGTSTVSNIILGAICIEVVFEVIVLGTPGVLQAPQGLQHSQEWEPLCGPQVLTFITDGKGWWERSC